MSGNLPPALAGLNNLTNLILSNNRLVGEIPADFGTLNALIELDLSVNLLSGELPVEIGDLTNLIELRLNHNQLKASCRRHCVISLSCGCSILAPTT